MDENENEKRNKGGYSVIFAFVKKEKRKKGRKGERKEKSSCQYTCGLGGERGRGGDD